MSWEISPHLLFPGKSLCRIGIISSLNAWYISLSYLGLGLFWREGGARDILTLVSVLKIVVGLFSLSGVSFGTLCLSKNFIHSSNWRLCWHIVIWNIALYSFNICIHYSYVLFFISDSDDLCLLFLINLFRVCNQYYGSSQITIFGFIYFSLMLS